MLFNIGVMNAAVTFYGLKFLFHESSAAKAS